MNRLEELQKLLDKERWVAVSVPQKYIGMIEHLHNPGSELGALLSAGKAETVPRVVSDDIQYPATESLLLLISTIYEHIQLIAKVPDVAYECASSLIETAKVRAVCCEAGRCSTRSPCILYWGPEQCNLVYSSRSRQATWRSAPRASASYWGSCRTSREGSSWRSRTRRNPPWRTL